MVRSGSVSSQALTPCQIGIANQTIDRYGRPYVYSCGCRRSTAFATLPAKICSSATPIILDARGSFGESGYKLQIIRTTAIGANTQVFQSTYTGQAGLIDLRALYAFPVGTYQIKLSTITNNGSCAGDVSVNNLQVYANGSGACGPVEPRPAPFTRLRIEASPNPATTTVSVRVFNPGAEALTIQLRDHMGRQKAVHPSVTAVDEHGYQTFSCAASELGTGVFRVEVFGTTQRGHTMVVIQP